MTNHFEMSSLLRDLSKLPSVSSPSAKMDRPESRPSQGKGARDGSRDRFGDGTDGDGTDAKPPTPPNHPKPGTQIYL